MNGLAQLKNATLRDTLLTIKKELCAIAGDRARLILYGSHARGQERDDSDVDLVVILPDDLHTPSIENAVREVIYEFADRTELFLSVMVLSETQASKYNRFPIHKNIEKEGISV